MNQRFYELDAIRGVAALMVVLFHYTVRYGELFGNDVDPLFTFEAGKYGVQLFFIVSGFVIFLTLDKTAKVSDFVVSRFSRLYPAYWFSVLLTFSVVYLFALPGRDVGIEAALVNLTMLQKWFRVANVDGVYWTLAVELSFYLIMILLFRFDQLKHIVRISLGWLALIAIGGVLEASGVKIGKTVKLMLLLEYGNLFIAGIMFYRVFIGGKGPEYAVLLACLAVEYFLRPESAIQILIYFGLFSLFVKGYLGVLAIKPLVYLGSISYSLYLIHQNLGYVIIRELQAAGMLDAVTVIVVPLLVSLLIAALMHECIERPALVSIRNWWKGRAVTSAEQSAGVAELERPLTVDNNR